MTGPAQPENKVLQRARDLASAPDQEPVAWAENVFTLLELVRGPNHSAVIGLRAYIDTARAHGRYRQGTFGGAIHGVANALLNDLESGFLPDLRTTIRAEVEGDFLAQAHRLLEEGLKDPAAMLLGAVLEDALRQLCRKHGVPEGNSIEAMNEPLRKADIYGLPQKQQVTAWAAIRNKADHGRFSEYTEPEIRVMHQGLTGFIATLLGG